MKTPLLTGKRYVVVEDKKHTASISPGESRKISDTALDTAQENLDGCKSGLSKILRNLLKVREAMEDANMQFPPRGSA